MNYFEVFLLYLLILQGERVLRVKFKLNKYFESSYRKYAVNLYLTILVVNLYIVLGHCCIIL